MKERKPSRRPNATGIPLLRSLMFGCLATVAVLVIGFGFQALATNPVFESAEPALSERGKQFERKFPAELYPTGADIRARQEHNSVVPPRESMPPMAKEATSREETSQIIAQGKGTNSQFVYNPYGRIAHIVAQYRYDAYGNVSKIQGTGGIELGFVLERN